MGRKVLAITVPKEKRDPCLLVKLLEEGPAILQWCHRWLCRMEQTGLDVPAFIQSASDAYFDEEDRLGQFIADELVEEFGVITASDLLRKRLTQLANGQGLAPWTQRILIKELRTRGFKDTKTSGKRGLKCDTSLKAAQLPN